MVDGFSRITRRGVLRGAASSAAMLLPGRAWGQTAGARGSAGERLRLPVLSQPEMMFVFCGDGDGERTALTRIGERWTGGAGAAGVQVDFAPTATTAVVSLASATAPVQRMHLRWRCRVPEDVMALGDAWERSYGDLQWQPLAAERAMPWYCMVQGHGQTIGMGVKTGASSFAFWQVDPDGVSLWLDVRNGSQGVRLGERTLRMATVVLYEDKQGESAFEATQGLCREMTSGVQRPTHRGGMPVDVVYGSNDWYYAYGRNTPEGILRDAELMASLAPAGAVRPFTVIDDGYQDRSRFPDMAALAEKIRGAGVIPGVWIRPLRAAKTTPASMLLPAARWQGGCGDEAPRAYDPTIPEALEAAAAVATEACGWGYKLVKHDFTTFELLGQWGSQMGASPTRGDWHMDDRTRTNAEVVTMLYRRLRQSCGEDRMIVGCNTIGHLSVGLFDASRTGDDVSGTNWERTRRLGVNTLAFRLPQNNAFYTVDADCVPLTPELPWDKSRQWLEVVARSGSVLLCSPDPRSIGPEQKAALREAFALCVSRPASEPTDWMETRTPDAWSNRSSRASTTGEPARYDWVLPEGETPFPIGIQRGPA